MSFLMDQHRIPSEVVYKLAQCGFTDVDTSAQFEDDLPRVREAIIPDLGIDPKSSPLHRAMVARIRSAWAGATERIKRRRTEEA